MILPCENVVRAYRLFAEKGVPGEVNNVGSGKRYRAQEVLDYLRSMANCEIPVRQDSDRMHPSDTPVICCNHDKLTVHTGWEPLLNIQAIVEDTLCYYRGLCK